MRKGAAAEASRERFSHYRQLIDKLAVPVDVTGELSDDFHFNVRAVRMGNGVELAENSISGARVVASRTKATVRRSDPEAYRLLLVLRGRADMTHCGRGGRFSVGDMGLFDTSSPFEVVRAGSSFAMFTFPRDRLSLPQTVMNDLVGGRLSGRSGVGAVVADFMRGFVREAEACSPADRARLGASAIDLLSVLAARELDVGVPVTTDARHRSTFLEAQRFIRDHVDDPDLAPEMIAAAHHISVRQLHKVFHQAGTTCAGEIRSRRLERCRHDLADPSQAGRPVSAIAARHGFRSEAHFSRSFRAAVGMPPGEWRAQQLDSY
ncbi:helix-turn-helix domain-containing protein [Actinoplanes solisilvae]|uniref:helix-turn-helix domain-containing protein n=1 Tax=Actinoplanes solisilvae TaxID=2486853 RepID=UPI000FDCD37A|nr:helix-turn-helix domain-containing protein [Actinoplanes solisilvae]